MTADNFPNSRGSRYALLGLLALAMMALVLLGLATRNWVSVWQGFGSLTMALESVEVSDERDLIVVDVTFVNESDQELRIHVLDTGIRLTGRSITAGTSRFDDVVLEPGERVSLQTTQAVRGPDRAVVTDHLAAGEGRWNVSGRVRVSVANLSEPLWLPFRYDVDIDP